MMINNAPEYQKMNEVEANHFWYKTLHNKVLEILKNKPKDIAILDIGCGTGGLIKKIIAAGFNNISGIDFSEHAIFYCQQSHLKVKQGDIRKIQEWSIYGKKYDIIICNDVLYQFEESVIRKIAKDLSILLNTNGILITNNQSLAAFKGTHDIAVGSQLRFNKKQLNAIFKQNNLDNISKFQHFWPFFLSPLIFITRFIQRISLVINKNSTTIKSDVNLPPKIINSLFFLICKLEQKLPFRGFWGSSIFSVYCHRGSSF